MTGFVLGTPGYLAPERRSGRPATVQSDLYSVGAVMIETLTGKRIGDGTIPTTGLPSPLRDIACRALAPDPRDRFTSAGDMLHALGIHSARVTQLARAQPVAAATTPKLTRPRTAIAKPRAAGPPAGRSRRRRRQALCAGVAALGTGRGAPLAVPGVRPTGNDTCHGVEARRRTPGTAPDGPRSHRSRVPRRVTRRRMGGPGDRALANALEASAAQKPGAARQSSAQRALTLAAALFDEGRLTSGQYGDVVNVLQLTGVAETTTSITAPSSPSFPRPFFQGHEHRHDHGYGNGYGSGSQG